MPNVNRAARDDQKFVIGKFVIGKTVIKKVINQGSGIKILNFLREGVHRLLKQDLLD
jgi:hypothetical protein